MPERQETLQYARGRKPAGKLSCWTWGPARASGRHHTRSTDFEKSAFSYSAISVVELTPTLELKRVAPNIQELRLNGYIPIDEQLREFKHLRRLEAKEYGTKENVAEAIKERVDKWKEVLSDCTITIRPTNHYWLQLSPWKHTVYIPPRAT